ncbi:hypothetical protein T492DRAFT_832743 [Pavlovales sp. CCMP2436]|nr:hypothetical protein T492DRAFT_832743 [Pavlovales sp. CCMP2436]
MILKGNRYEEPGDPPSLRRIPNSQTGFERVYNRMMRDAKKNEYTPSARNNKYTTLFDHTDFADRGINLKHRGALREVTTITTTGGASGSNLNIADAPTINCLIAGFYHRLSIKKDQIEDELKLLPVQRKGRPKAGEIRDAKSAEERTRLNREHKNITKRADDLLALNERVQILGGIKHTDLHLMKEIIQLSGANSLTIISPLYPKFGSYLHVDNPNPITELMKSDDAIQFVG